MRSINFNAPPRPRSFEEEQLRKEARRRKESTSLNTTSVKFEAAQQHPKDDGGTGNGGEGVEVDQGDTEGSAGNGDKPRVVDQKWANYNSARVPANATQAAPVQHAPPPGKPPRAAIRQTRRSLDMIAKARAQAKLEQSRMEFFKR